MPLMTWTVEQHGTNVSFADNEHQQVFRNLNILYHLRTTGAEDAEITEELRTLLSIITAHFSHEENEMRAKNFIGYDRHKVEHDDLIDTCIAMQLKIEAGKFELTERVCLLIKSWFNSHIPEYDKAYAQVLNG